MVYKFKCGNKEIIVPKTTESLLYKYDLGLNVNLNNLTQEGYYHQPANINTSSSLNYPTNEAGLLTVINRNYIYQTYHSFNNSGYWYRSQYNGTWYGWKKIPNINGDTFYGNVYASNARLISYNYSNTIEIGALNNSYIHFISSGVPHYFNKSVHVAGEIYGGNNYNRKVAYQDEIADSGWVAVTYGYGISTYSGYASVRVRKIGKVVQLQGYLTNSTTWSTHDSIVTVPYGYRPVSMCSGVMQGSMSNRFQLQIGGDGIGKADRYSNNTTTSNTVPVGAWLCISMVWITDQ